jgi:hypothetical protein
MRIEHDPWVVDHVPTYFIHIYALKTAKNYQVASLFLTNPNFTLIPIIIIIYRSSSFFQSSTINFTNMVIQLQLYLSLSNQLQL